MILQLRITVAYDPNEESEEWLRDELICLAQSAVSNGQLTGASTAEVDSWDAEVIRID